MNRLLAKTRRWLLLLFLCALALGALRNPSPGSGRGVELLLAAAIVAAVIWNLRRALRLLRPGRERGSAPQRPELPGRSEWIGPRNRDYERRG